MNLYDIYDIIICSHENNMPLCQLTHFGPMMYPYSLLVPVDQNVLNKLGKNHK